MFIRPQTVLLRGGVEISVDRKCIRITERDGTRHTILVSSGGGILKIERRELTSQTEAAT